MEKMFQMAIRNKFRFPFKGLISSEDLYDLSVENLDIIFKSLNSEIKKAKEESLLDIKTSEDKILQAKIEIVKYIVSIKLEEKRIKENEKKNKEERQKILSIIANKQENELQNKSIEELEKMLQNTL